MAMYGNLDAVRAGVLDGLDHNFVSKLNKVAMKFGDPVFVATGNETDGVAPDSTDATRKFAGVAVLVQQATKAVEGEYPVNELVSVCTSGEIWVRVPDALTLCANKPAHVVDLIANGEYKKFDATANANTYDNVGYFTSNPISLGTGQTFAKVMLSGTK
jgi:hypothetical protein